MFHSDGIQDKQVPQGGKESADRNIKINCNTGTVSTNLMETYRKMKVWYLPDRITNIFSMHEVEKLYSITYDSW
jgi:hypothetical protein